MWITALPLNLKFTYNLQVSRIDRLHSLIARLRESVMRMNTMGLLVGQSCHLNFNADKVGSAKIIDIESNKDKIGCSDLPVACQLEGHRIIEVEAYLIAEADGFKRSPLDY